MSEKVKEITRKSYHLKNLFLDPNNYRFVDNADYKYVADEEVLDTAVQKRTSIFIEGNKRQNISDLIDSFKANGFLYVDVIQVRDLGDNQYLVIEGNRRVAALKALQEDHEKGLDIGKLSPDIFRSVPFEIHDNEAAEKHLIIMGLKHISGNKKWSAYNQSKLIHDFLKEYWQTDLYYQKEEELCNSLGTTKQKIRTSQRAHYLILEYLKSDYGDQFESDMYTIFTEIIKRPSIKQWLDWDDSSYSASNKINQERLFSWISMTEEICEENFDDERDDDKVENEFEPIINSYRQIRDLAAFINNSNALLEMEQSRSVVRGLLASGEVEKINYEKAIADFKNAAHSIESYRELLSIDDINEVKNVFNQVIPENRAINILQANVAIAFEHGVIKHFNSIKVDNYRVLNNFELHNLNRINIFSGFNNCGKTSLLEAVYLLTKQNDIGAYMELLRLKNKSEKLNSILLNRILNTNIKISGNFNKIKTSVLLKKYDDAKIDKKDDYITSYELASFIEQDSFNNIIHTFSYNPVIRENKGVKNLCFSLIKSPYFYSLNEVLNTHEKSIRIKDTHGQTAMHLIVEFLKKIDNKIKYIELAQLDEGVKRFIVDSDSSSDNLDITHYGEGVQRIFELALSFAYCKNGVLCIDEFETAIHYSLLVDFTEFVQKLAVEFNVQVFITTHSKECLSAFVENGISNKDIAFFTLVRNKENKIKSIFYDSENLQKSLEQNLEVRGW